MLCRAAAGAGAGSGARICPTSTGHIQATGIDAAGRRQYRYHDHWRATTSTRRTWAAGSPASVNATSSGRSAAL